MICSSNLKQIIDLNSIHDPMVRRFRPWVIAMVFGWSSLFVDLFCAKKIMPLEAREQRLSISMLKSLSLCYSVSAKTLAY